MLQEEARRMLEERLIPFWLSLRDDTHGGFYGYLDFDLRLDRRAEKGCILNNRILWFFSRCASQLGRADCLAAAEHAYRFLTGRCIDQINGGLFWSVTYDGVPLDTTKHTYNQAFAIYALAAYYEASGDERALALARGLFYLIETRCRDTGGYLEAFDQRFHPAENEKLSENGVLAQRTMNTLLHVFEGYAGLYQACGDAQVKRAMVEILTIYRKKIYNPALRRQEVFFDRDYHPLIDLHSYGHDIESSWLIDWGCSLLGEPELEREIGAIDQEMAHEILRRAYANGSVMNERERGVDNTTRVWWVQAEAVLGFLNAWEKEPDCGAFREAAGTVWRYINTTLVDPRPGSEWYWEVDEHGVPSSRKPIVEPWKCPYHNGRLCLEILRRKF